MNGDEVHGPTNHTLSAIILYETQLISKPPICLFDGLNDTRCCIDLIEFCKKNPCKMPCCQMKTYRTITMIRDDIKSEATIEGIDNYNSLLSDNTGGIISFRELLNKVISIMVDFLKTADVSRKYENLL